MYQLPDAVKRVEADVSKGCGEDARVRRGGRDWFGLCLQRLLIRVGSRGRGKSRRVEESEDDDRKIFVGRLPHSATAEELMERFKDFGSVENVACIPDVAMGYSCKGFAFITFKTPEEANAAVARRTGRCSVTDRWRFA